MHKLPLMFVLILSLGCAGTKNDAAKVAGTWIPVKEVAGGTQIPAEAFKNQKLMLLDSTYTATAESVDKGIVRYSDNKMDIYGKEGVNNGKHFTAIYKLENGELSICYNLSGDKYPESFETANHSMYFLCVFKKN
jgi:uncharacterized protein (TIGR03067 family)